MSGSGSGLGSESGLESATRYKREGGECKGGSSKHSFRYKQHFQKFTGCFDGGICGYKNWNYHGQIQF
jgi:hypothetical protein